MENIYKKVNKLVQKSENILVVPHRRPDADALGSAIALKMWMNGLGKSVTLACTDKPSKNFEFLPHIDEFVDNFELSEFDLLIIVDAGADHMTNFHLKYENFLSGLVPIINIDHHASNDKFGMLNIVDPLSASTTVIIYRMFKKLGVECSVDMATCLLAGIYGDTGGFMHSNTSAEVYEIAADLMEMGANVKDISKNLFRTRPLSTLKLWGQVLEGATITPDNIVLSAVKNEDYDLAQANPEQLSGVIDYLNMVPNAKFALLINEDRKGNVKGSFRTRQDDLDLSKIAADFGGGGHPKASGFSVPGKLQKEFRYTIISDDMSKKSLKF